jgi:hypothetical protein
MNRQDTRNKYFFGLGTIGRTCSTPCKSLFLMVFLTEILDCQS